MTTSQKAIMPSDTMPTCLPSPSLKKGKIRGGDCLGAASEHFSSFSPKPKPLVVRRVASFTPGKAGKATAIVGGVSARVRLVSFPKELSQVVGEVNTRSEMSSEDIANTWYSKDEFKTMKTQYIPIVKKIAKKLELAEGEDPRGLEHKTPRGNKARQINRFQAMDAVLDEQERQWENERKDPEYIAQIYRQSSAHCQMNAYLLAKKDAEFVAKEVRQTEARDLAEEDTPGKGQAPNHNKSDEVSEKRVEGKFLSRQLESPTTPVRKQRSSKQLHSVAIPEVLSPQLLASVRV